MPMRLPVRFNLARRAFRPIYLRRTNEHVGLRRDILLCIHEMRVRILPFVAFLVAFLAIVPSHELRAEFVCSTDVSYTWAKTPPEKPAPVDADPSMPPGGHSKGASPTAPPPAEPTPKPSIIRFAGVQRYGLDEAGAKANLKIEVNRQKARASEACKRDHESIGDCMATKLSTKSSTLNSLGFSARAELEKALTRECSEQQGVCLSVESSEPQCRDLTPAKVADSGAGTGAAGKKQDPKKPESKKK